MIFHASKHHLVILLLSALAEKNLGYGVIISSGTIIKITSALVQNLTLDLDHTLDLFYVGETKEQDQEQE